MSEPPKTGLQIFKIGAISLLVILTASAGYIALTISPHVQLVPTTLTRTATTVTGTSVFTEVQYITKTAPNSTATISGDPRNTTYTQISFVTNSATETVQATTTETVPTTYFNHAFITETLNGSTTTSYVIVSSATVVFVTQVITLTTTSPGPTETQTQTLLSTTTQNLTTTRHETTTLPGSNSTTTTTTTDPVTLTRTETSTSTEPGQNFTTTDFSTRTRTETTTALGQNFTTTTTEPGPTTTTTQTLVINNGTTTTIGLGPRVIDACAPPIQCSLEVFNQQQGVFVGVPPSSPSPNYLPLLIAGASVGAIVLTAGIVFRLKAKVAEPPQSAKS